MKDVDIFMNALGYGKLDKLGGYQPKTNVSGSNSVPPPKTDGRVPEKKPNWANVSPEIVGELDKLGGRTQVLVLEVGWLDRDLDFRALAGSDGDKYRVDTNTLPDGVDLTHTVDSDICTEIWYTHERAMGLEEELRTAKRVAFATDKELSLKCEEVKTLTEQLEQTRTREGVLIVEKRFMQAELDMKSKCIVGLCNQLDVLDNELCTARGRCVDQELSRDESVRQNIDLTYERDRAVEQASEYFIRSTYLEKELERVLSELADARAYKPSWCH